MALFNLSNYVLHSFVCAAHKLPRKRNQSFNKLKELSQNGKMCITKNNEETIKLANRFCCTCLESFFFIADPVPSQRVEVNLSNAFFLVMWGENLKIISWTLDINCARIFMASLAICRSALNKSHVLCGGTGEVWAVGWGKLKIKA